MIVLIRKIIEKKKTAPFFIGYKIIKERISIVTNTFEKRFIDNIS